MDLKQRAQETVQAIEEVVGTELSAGQREAVNKAIKKLVVEAMRECAASCSKAATVCCSPDEDMAHKIASEVERAREALIANLSSLR